VFQWLCQPRKRAGAGTGAAIGGFPASGTRPCRLRASSASHSAVWSKTQFYVKLPAISHLIAAAITTPMKTYAIGDLQGCIHEAQLLLDRILEDAGGPATIVFVGDLVNRGPASLEALRRVRTMCEASEGRIEALLGNHDLHLLAVACGAQPASKSDTFDEILAAPDRDALMEWLRRRPLAKLVGGHLLVHAGVFPQWTAEQTIALAGEVEAVLRGPGWIDFLGQMYGNQPDRWDDSLAGIARLRCIVNALTRMRFCAPGGVMEFGQKESAGAPSGSNLAPWFDLPGRRTLDVTVVFGHWSALGLLLRPDVIGLDSGCVWGGKLSAVCLDDRALLQVDCPEYKEHAGKIKEKS
jgi:bis(5'-nucleosyl)-tetraphosphatase (symmetrical)